MAANADERRKRWKRRKRQKYTVAKRMEILNAVDEAGVVEAARVRIDLPQRIARLDGALRVVVVGVEVLAHRLCGQYMEHVGGMAR